MADTSQTCDGRVVWSYTSALLVFVMIPGLAFFEGGLVRAKNTVSIFTQVLTGHSMLTVMWIVVGYTLTFGDDAGQGFIGDLRHSFLLNMNMTSYLYARENSDCTGVPPRGVNAFYELMFASICPLLMTGAYAERLKFRHFLLFTALWEFFVYYPVAHSIWGPGGWLGEMGVVDFAGGIVIHITSGTSAVLLAWMIGMRSDWEACEGNYRPSNLPLAATGCAMLWFGWGGFNAGGSDAGPVANLALINSHSAACISSMTWFFLALRVGNKPRVTAVMNGAVAGLAAITPCAGYVSYQAGMALGLLAGVGSFGAAYLIKEKLHIDDALEVGAVHGASSIIGVLYVGVAANNYTGGITASPKQFGLQLLGCVVAATYSALWTCVLIYLCVKVFGPMRITAEEEEQGLDIVEHQEVAYQEQDTAEEVIEESFSPRRGVVQTRTLSYRNLRHDQPSSTALTTLTDQTPLNAAIDNFPSFQSNKS